MRTKGLLAAVLVWLAIPAHAVGRFTDATDLWWNSAQAGWGVNVVQQNEILFMTFFVYGPNNNAVWYSASEVRFVGDATGEKVFTGDLYETRGPWLADFFNPANVTYRKVGTVMFRMSSPNAASLLYSVDGVSVQKQLTRFTWRTNEFAGRYLGTTAGTYSQCPSGLADGYREETGLQMTVMQSLSPSSVTIRFTAADRTCNFGGPYTQSGRLGSFSGSYFCTDNTFGTFEATDVEINPQAFSARLTARTSRCDFSGRVGGLVRD